MTVVPTLITSIQHSMGSPLQSKWKKKKKKDIQTGKGEVKLALLADDIILYRENSVDSTQKLLELNEFSKVSGYKIDIQKLVAFLHTNNELSEKKIKKTISFTIASKTINYWEISLTKEMKGLYTKNYKPLIKRIEKDTNK